MKVFPYSILYELNVEILFTYKNIVNLQLNLCIFFLHYLFSSTSKCKQDIIKLS